MTNETDHNWLTVLEQKRRPLIFLVEWGGVFLLAWLFWSLMFHWAPGSVPPSTAALVISALYATATIYGRLLRATGCRKCDNPMPFMRREVARRRLPDREECTALQYGGEAWEVTPTLMYSRMIRTDIVTFQCRKCGQVWEEKRAEPATPYRKVGRSRARK